LLLPGGAVLLLSLLPPVPAAARKRGLLEQELKAAADGPCRSIPLVVVDARKALALPLNSSSSTSKGQRYRCIMMSWMLLLYTGSRQPSECGR
jgi:hypothetical protein